MYVGEEFGQLLTPPACPAGSMALVYFLLWNRERERAVSQPLKGHCQEDSRLKQESSELDAREDF